jgi:hypothetical protein
MERSVIRATALPLAYQYGTAAPGFAALNRGLQCYSERDSGNPPHC